MLGLLACVVSISVGQEERPQIFPGERKAPRKKDAGPRAVAVLQMTPNGKASLVPIAILINGKFWDASAYKADPVPMALDAGNVYEAEQAGSSLGLFTVNAALHSNAQNTAAPWLGTGTWRPAGSEERPKAAKADITPVGINIEEAPPRLTHDVTNQSAPATPNASGSPNSAPPETKKSGGNSGDEPPRLSKPTAPSTSDSPAGTQIPASSSPASSSDDSKQKDSKSRDVKAEQANVPASDSGAGEANRPRLRRGKPAESFADEDVPGYSKPGAQSSSPSDKVKVVETAATKSDIKLIPAISDAGGPPPHSYHFEWLKGEEEQRRGQMMDLAKQEFRAYLAAHVRTPAPPKASRTATARKKAVLEPIFENVQMTAYDLWNSNQAVIVMTATAHMPALPAGAAESESQSDLQYSICLVTYPDTYNNLHKVYSGITDRFHLDVTPRLELIDAVDADGDGRGELLFRESSDLGTGWILYRVTADKLWKMFDSLNPE